MSESLCFYDSWRAHKDGEISSEANLKHILRHIFAGIHHADDDQHSDEMIRYWCGRDIISAAVMVYMRLEDFRPSPSSEETLINMILQSKSANLEQLREIDTQMSNSASVLAIPQLYQLIVAAAIKSGNRSLVREMISATAPSFGYDILFSYDKGSTCSIDTPDHAFGESRGYGHPALAGQRDNGCDLWATMIRAGWATPRLYMQSWAASAGSPEAGKQLLDVLKDHGIAIDSSAAHSALLYQRFELLDYVLTIYTPSDESDKNDLLRVASSYRSEGVRYLELLFRHGVDCINWQPTAAEAGDGVHSMPMSREDRVPSRTPLHVAADDGDPQVVEWLLQQGAEPIRDYFGMTALDLARKQSNENIMAVFARYPAWAGS